MLMKICIIFSCYPGLIWDSFVIICFSLSPFPASLASAEVILEKWVPCAYCREKDNQVTWLLEAWCSRKNINSLEVCLILRIPLDYEGINMERMPLTALAPVQFKRRGRVNVFWARVTFKIPWSRLWQIYSVKSQRVSTFALWPMWFLSWLLNSAVERSNW